MDSDITIDLIIVLALIIANGLFSMTELAIVNSKKSKLEELANQNNHAAKRALSLLEDPNQMFSTVQIGITLVGIITGLYSGATFAEPLSDWIRSVAPAIEHYASSISSFIIIALTTYLSLMIGELVPKRLALNSPETIAMSVAHPIYYLSLALKPIVVFLSASTNIFLKVLGVKNKEEAPVTESEINKMLTDGVAMGAFEEEEPVLVDNIFRLADLNASDVMTPRTQLKWIDLNSDEEDIKSILATAHHYRIPVGKDSLDDLIGLVTVSDILTLQMTKTKEQSLTDMIYECTKEPLLVPESITLMKLLELFRQEGVHETIVLDEYGAFSGLVTLHDIMEEIVGLMPSGEEEKQEEENRVIQRSETTWLVDGLLNIDEFKDYFSITKELPGQLDDLYKTMGGFVTYLVGRIPKETDTCHWDAYTFEVMDMDNTRVDKIMITYEPPIDEDTSEETDSI